MEKKKKTYKIFLNKWQLLGGLCDHIIKHKKGKEGENCLGLKQKKKKRLKSKRREKISFVLFCYKYCNYLSIFSFVFKFVFLPTVFVSKKKNVPQKRKKKNNFCKSISSFLYSHLSRMVCLFLSLFRYNIVVACELTILFYISLIS